MADTERLEPFLKWVGGKRWFVERYANLLPKASQRYFEPFLGGGAVFFHLQPKRALLADLNQELIATYKAVKRDWREVWKHLKYHQRVHSTTHYYDVRSLKCADLYAEAARFIYLNRTCFNGIYRVNLRGEFNVPRGTKDTVIFSHDRFAEIADALSRATLMCADFALVIDKAQEGDFVFVDPPYTAQHNANGFLKYNQKIFSWEDQVRLRDAVLRAKKRNVLLAVTNADHQSVRSLYRGIGKVRSIGRPSVISGVSKGRVQVTELLATVNY